MLKRYYVLASEGGYWSEAHQAFKGRLFATKYENHTQYYKQVEAAAKAANGDLVEAKHIYVWEN